MDTVVECVCGCGEPAMYAERHARAKLKVRIDPTDYVAVACGYESDCWLFRGKRGAGYANVRLRGTQLYAHRAMYLQEVGPIPAGYHVHHRCEVTRCCRPSHLEAVRRNEHHVKYHPLALDAARVKAIRASTEAAVTLADAYGVSESTVYQIKQGKTWKHVT